MYYRLLLCTATIYCILQYVKLYYHKCNNRIVFIFHVIFCLMLQLVFFPGKVAVSLAQYHE